MTTSTETFFAIIGTHGNSTIYGVGAEEFAAWADAEEWAEDTAGLACVPCTRGLHDEVLANGAPRKYSELPDGRLCLIDEMNDSP